MRTEFAKMAFGLPLTVIGHIHHKIDLWRWERKMRRIDREFRETMFAAQEAQHAAAMEREHVEREKDAAFLRALRVRFETALQIQDARVHAAVPPSIPPEDDIVVVSSLMHQPCEDCGALHHAPTEEGHRSAEVPTAHPAYPTGVAPHGGRQD